ncbi:MAG: MoaD/ThiS family protein [Ruminococcaceae bacterium]|nr:MoaD/ThiS family protein [Oscillospiraceae bacterium]
MKIEFHGPGMCDFSKMDKMGYIEVPEGTTLRQFLKIVKLPIIWTKVFPLFVNYEKVPMNTVLKDGDIVSAFLPTVGG